MGDDASPLRGGHRRWPEMGQLAGDAARFRLVPLGDRSPGVDAVALQYLY